MHRIVALAIPEVVAFDLSIPAEVFGHRAERDRYSFAVAAPRPGPVATTTGFSIQAGAGLPVLRGADTIVVAGFTPFDSAPPEVLDALREAAARGARIASISTGAFALAAAGLLDGRRATTHWEQARTLASRFPAVSVNPSVLFVDEGQILTSAGAAAGLDLCLHIVRNDHGTATANQVSRRMVAALHRSGGQALYMRSPLPGAGPTLATTCEWVVSEMHRPITVAEMASHASLSQSFFVRRFSAEMGMAPMHWLTTQRVLEARRLLEATELPVEEIAQRCGLGTAGNLRLHLGRETASTPSAYRRAFRANGAGEEELSSGSDAAPQAGADGAPEASTATETDRTSEASTATETDRTSEASTATEANRTSDASPPPDAISSDPRAGRTRSAERAPSPPVSSP